VTGRVIFTPPNPHNCQPGTTRAPRLLPPAGGGYKAKPALTYGSLWRCDDCLQVWEFNEDRKWARKAANGQEKPRWIVWSLVAVLVFALVVYGITEALTHG
jgi:hypothetical protein